MTAEQDCLAPQAPTRGPPATPSVDSTTTEDTAATDPPWEATDATPTAAIATATIAANGNNGGGNTDSNRGYWDLETPRPNQLPPLPDNTLYSVAPTPIPKFINFHLGSDDKFLSPWQLTSAEFGAISERHMLFGREAEQGV